VLVYLSLGSGRPSYIVPHIACKRFFGWWTDDVAAKKQSCRTITQTSTTLLFTAYIIIIIIIIITRYDSDETKSHGLSLFTSGVTLKRANASHQHTHQRFFEGTKKAMGGLLRENWSPGEKARKEQFSWQGDGGRGRRIGVNSSITITIISSNSMHDLICAKNGSFHKKRSHAEVLPPLAGS